MTNQMVYIWSDLVVESCRLELDFADRPLRGPVQSYDRTACSQLMRQKSIRDDL